MHIDASRYGNISRFVNHAPESNDNSSDSQLLDANLKTISHTLNGIEMIFFKATRAISIGEQLLVNYGENSFKTHSMARFTSHGKVIYKDKRGLWKRSQQKMAHLKIMARHGLKKAQYYILLRLFLISMVLFIIVKSF
ncbi:SET domain-containing protein-lysine N-methyltransferase [Legionella tunisiensis]|uniref:SET domain-containing protein-lysine N-methyltransferase n=1 Tax=Legionella tunisiensis TaxID=1034944 RepID=UPI0002E54814